MLSLFPPQPEPLEDVTLGRTVTVRGEVMPRDAIESTLTGKRCVYYRYTVEQFRNSGLFADDGFWRVVRRDEAIAEFYLVQGENRAIVSPQDVTVDRDKKLVLPSLDLGGISNERANEFIIEAGDIVEVTAIAEEADDMHDEGRGYRSPTRSILLRPPDRGKTQIRLIRKCSAVDRRP
jgi:uncharacterized protein with LGFP repeats